MERPGGASRRDKSQRNLGCDLGLCVIAAVVGAMISTVTEWALDIKFSGPGVLVKEIQPPVTPKVVPPAPVEDKCVNFKWEPIPRLTETPQTEEGRP